MVSIAKNRMWKHIVAITVMAMLLLSSIFSVTFAFLSDKKDSAITINVAKMQTESTTETLNSSELIAGKTFTKTLTYNVESSFDIYFRVYAVSNTQAYSSDKSEIENRPDFVSLIDVTTCKIGGDNKYYYTNSTNAPISTGSNTYTLNYSFKVSPLVNEEIYTDASGNINKTLKTTITYYFEYCQVSGWEEWNDYNGGNSSNSLNAASYTFKANTTQAATPTQDSPQSFKNAGELITEDNYTFYNASKKEIGKYALPISNNACDNLFDIDSAVNGAALINNKDTTYTLQATNSGRASRLLNINLPASTYTFSMDVIDYSITNTGYLITLELVNASDATSWSSLNIDKITNNKVSSTLTFSKNIKAIRLWISNSDALGDYVTFKNFKLERNTTATDYIPYGFGKNLFENVIVNDTNYDNDGLKCNLIEGKTYRLTYDINVNSLTWFKISSYPSGYNCVQYHSSTSALSDNGIYNGIVFTFKRDSHIPALDSLYIFLTVNQIAINSENSYLLDNMNIRLEEVYDVPAGKNVFTSHTLLYSSNTSLNNGFTFDEDTQILKINCANDTTFLKNLYTFINTLPSNTTFSTKVFVLGGSSSGSGTIKIGGYNSNSSTFEELISLTGSLKAGDVISKTITSTVDFTNFYISKASGIALGNLQLQVMVELCEENDASSSYITYKKSGTSYVILKAPLCSVDSYADTIDLKRGIVIKNTNLLNITGYTSIDKISYSLWSNQNSENTAAGYLSSNTILGKYDASAPNCGGFYIANAGISTHFTRKTSGTVHTIEDITGFSVIPTASPPYLAFRVNLTDKTMAGFLNFFKSQYDAGTPVQVILAYYGAPKVDTVNLPSSITVGDEELNLYTINGTITKN